MTVESHGITIDTPGAFTAKSGMKIAIQGTAVTLTKVTKGSVATATKAYLLNAAQSVLASADFSGDDATFNYALSASTSYFVVGDNDGSSFNQSYGATSAYPVSGTYLNWTGDLRDGAESTDYAATIASVTVVIPDTTAPADTTDLVATSLSDTEVKLEWTAPGDDGSVGTASSYDVRYSTSAITEGNWAAATEASGEPTPGIAGTEEEMEVSGLDADTTYYFGLKTSDEVPNESGLSNVPSVDTDVAPTPVVPPTFYNVKSRRLKRDWPIESGLVAGSTKQEGRSLNVPPSSGSGVERRKKGVLIDV